MAMALLFIASLPISAFAETYYLDNGSIEITATAADNGTDTNYAVSQYNGSSWDTKESTTEAPVITQNNSETEISNTVTINADGENATAKVTLSGVNIEGISTDKAAVSTNGAGSVVVELDGNNIVKGGYGHAGLEKNSNGSLTITDTNNDGSLTADGGYSRAGIGGSNITISGGTVTANGGYGGAGIGGGNGGNGSDITISGGTVTATGGISGAGIGGGKGGNGSSITISGGTVTAKGSDGGAGIGGGMGGGCESITVSGDAQVSVQGGGFEVFDYSSGGECLKDGGACIGKGGEKTEVDPLNITINPGTEVAPDVSKLTANGKIEYYATGADMSTDEPIEDRTIIGKYDPSDDKKPDGKPDEKPESKTASQTASPAVKSYSVVDKDGRNIGYKTEVKDGVQTVTVDGDYAVLTGTAANISALTSQGITTVVFVTSGATSTFDLADLSAKGSGTYKLTHDGATVTFTLGTTDISEILK